MHRLIFALAFVITSLPWPSTSLAAVRSGWLHTLWADGPSDSGSNDVELRLIDDLGRSVTLARGRRPAADANGRALIEGERVDIEFEGDASGRGATTGALPRWHVVGPSGDESPGRSISPSHPEAPVMGEHRSLAILCRFPEVPDRPPARDTLNLLLGSNPPGLDHYWREVSYGLVSTPASVVLRWYDLPHPRSFYVQDKNGDGDTIDVWEADTARLQADCEAAADADVFFPNYSIVHFAFNADVDCCAYGGPSTRTLDGVTKAYAGTILPPWAWKSQSTLAHEVGHGFGLHHSSGPYATPYDSGWDVMSWGSMWVPQYETTVGVHTIAFHKSRLGWIPPDRILTVPRGAGQARTVELSTASRPGDSGYLEIRVPRTTSPERFYSIEARTFAGYDSGLPGEAVVIHDVDRTRDDREAQVVDPDGNGSPNDDAAKWQPGEVFEDEAAGISIAVMRRTSSGFDVSVSVDAASCVPSETTLCLLDRRFSATLRWNDGGPHGLRDAYVASPRSDGAESAAGLFYFFRNDPNNWEVLAKMIDGCGTNGQFWLLVSASTGFEWYLTVRDEVTGEVTTLRHPLDGNASGAANFAAFPCGPARSGGE